ncbi:MAG: ATP-binding cassette domain-containing protein [Cellvibrionaceae bacterium]
MPIFEINNQQDAICIEGYSLSLSHRVVLDNIDFSVKFGAITTLIGPNGAGKTTLLRVMAGDFSRQESGLKIKMADELNASKKTLLDRAKNVAVLPQYSELQFPFTVKEVVALGRIPHSVNHQINEKIIQDVMSRMQVDDLAEVQYTLLSGGEKQRVQLARAFAQIWDKDFLVCEPGGDKKLFKNKLLLLDEPTASLDLSYQECFVDVLRYLSSFGVAIVVVSHDINLSLKYTDVFSAMKNGSIVDKGKKDIITPELIKELFNIDASVVPHPCGGKMVAF